MGKNRISYAIYAPNFRYGNAEILLANSQHITPEEYEPDMQGQLFCPRCFTPLSRSPIRKNLSKKASTAHFRHLPSYSHIPCDDRILQKQGLKYINEEVTSQTEENPEIKQVTEWSELPPEQKPKTGRPIVYPGLVEDPNGEITEKAISRYSGEVIERGAKIKTVQHICTEFGKLLNVGFKLPGTSSNGALKDLLFNTKRLRNDLKEPQLFYGKIKGFRSQTFLNRTKIEWKDNKVIYIYTKREMDVHRGQRGQNNTLNELSKGRYVIFHGFVEWDENKPYVMLSRWGAYALLPQKHEHYLTAVTDYKYS